MDYSMPGFPVLHYFPEPAQTQVHWVSDAIQPSHLLSPPSSPASIFPSIRIFSIESVLCSRWPKYWSFSLSISPSNEYSLLISFRIDWFDLLAVQPAFQFCTNQPNDCPEWLCHFMFPPAMYPAALHLHQHLILSLPFISAILKSSNIFWFYFAFP